MLAYILPNKTLGSTGAAKRHLGPEGATDSYPVVAPSEEKFPSLGIASVSQDAIKAASHESSRPHAEDTDEQEQKSKPVKTKITSSLIIGQPLRQSHAQILI